ncbi:Hypothetical predicted protein [Pelobates cultripes]|uniref:Uncharacterized protein n=1 Tax=Pelobates cultripes TaxID=61616 RepID=A0AAD1VX71_PELCU|nr:Hypothetical predicted protein [Pelobates cultripes]
MATITKATYQATSRMELYPTDGIRDINSGYNTTEGSFVSLPDVCTASYIEPKGRAAHYPDTNLEIDNTTLFHPTNPDATSRSHTLLAYT